MAGQSAWFDKVSQRKLGKDLTLRTLSWYSTFVRNLLRLLGLESCGYVVIWSKVGFNKGYE